MMRFVELYRDIIALSLLSQRPGYPLGARGAALTCNQCR
jgi:hypothetical protein